MGRVLLIRHGQTAWNRRKVFRGRADPELDEVGQAQAQALARTLADLELEAIYSSPLLRSIQTAEPIAQEHGFQVVSSYEFIDMDFGEWQRKGVEEVKAIYPELYQMWREEPHLIKLPGGEGLEEVAKRAFPALKEVATRHALSAIVTHQVVSRVLICLVLELPLSHFWSFSQEPCCINEIELTDRGFGLISLNERCHLKNFSD